MQRQSLLKKYIEIGNKLQRVYAEAGLVQPKRKKTEFCTCWRGDEAYWLTQLLLSFYFNVARVCTQVNEYTFVQCFYPTNPIDEVDNILKYLCLRWANKVEIGYKINFDANQSDVIESGEWYGLVSSSSIKSVHHIIWSKHSTLPFCCSAHRSNLQ